MKDRLITQIAKKTTSKETLEALATLYQSFGVSRQMELRNKISTIRMSNIDIMVSNLVRDIELKDQLACIGKKWRIRSWCPLPQMDLLQLGNLLSKVFVLMSINQIT
jgi:hypothetical protein